MTAKRVILDACVPHRLRTALHRFNVQTAHFAGLDRLDDRALLVAIDGLFDVLVTLDHGMLRQQRITGRRFGVVVMRVPVQLPDVFAALAPTLIAAVKMVEAGQVRLVLHEPGGLDNWTHITDLA